MSKKFSRKLYKQITKDVEDSIKQFGEANELLEAVEYALTDDMCDVEAFEGPDADLITAVGEIAEQATECTDRLMTLLAGFKKRHAKKPKKPVDYVVSEAALRIAAADEILLSEILAMLNYDPSKFNELVLVLLEEYDAHLVYEAPGATIYDGCPSFENGLFFYEGGAYEGGPTSENTQSYNRKVTIPHDAYFEIH